MTFDKIRKKQKPRVYLGLLEVVPRRGIKKYFDETGVFNKTNLEKGLRENLNEIFSLPLASKLQEPNKTDLGIDISIPDYQAGEVIYMSLGSFGSHLFWRPKVTVKSRLYNLKSNKTKVTLTVTETMGLREYINRIFSWRGLFGFSPSFDSDDMEILLYKACHKNLIKLQKKYS